MHAFTSDAARDHASGRVTPRNHSVTCATRIDRLKSGLGHRSSTDGKRRAIRAYSRKPMITGLITACPYCPLRRQ